MIERAQAAGASPTAGTLGNPTLPPAGWRSTTPTPSGQSRRTSQLGARYRVLAEVNLRSHASYQMVNRHRPSASWTGNSRRGLTRRLTEWDKVEKWPHRLRHLTVGACSKAPPQPPTVRSRRARASHPHPSRALARKQETAHLPFAHRDVAEPWGVQTPSGSSHSPSLRPAFVPREGEGVYLDGMKYYAQTEGETEYFAQVLGREGNTRFQSPASSPRQLRP